VSDDLMRAYMLDRHNSEAADRMLGRMMMAAIAITLIAACITLAI
jgi:hypothetical protein